MRYQVEKWGSIVLGTLVVLAVLYLPTMQYVGWRAQAATLNSPAVQPFAACGRLTLQTGVPVMVTSSTSATTLYYTTYGCDRISLYNGSDLVAYEFAELSNITTASSTGSAGPAVVASGSNYDYFVWNKTGTLTLTRGPLWTNTTTRAMGLSQVHGVYVNGAAITNGPAINRGLYVGTAHAAADATLNYAFGTAATGALWGAADHQVWNMYNRRPVKGFVGAPTTQWTYNNTTIHAAGGQTATARVAFTYGLNEDPVYALWGTRAQTGGSSSAGEQGIGLDLTTAFSGPINPANFTASSYSTPYGTYGGPAGLGTHFLSAVEGCSAAQTVTFSPGNTSAPVFSVGMPYELMM